MDRLRQGAVLDRDRAGSKLAEAVSLLVSHGELLPAVRLLIDIGRYETSEIAEALGVMHATVGRWHDGETCPAPETSARYGERLIDLMRPGTRRDPADVHGPE